MPKSPDAFRTISEVADWLRIQAHVLRFWESKFTQVKPIKRAGGRRYYRPADMLLLGGIRKLLHDDGLTIKGVQKILREEGMSHVAAMSMPLDEADIEAHVTAPAPKLQRPDPVPEAAVVLPFEAPKEAERTEAAPELQKPAAQVDAPEQDTGDAAEQLETNLDEAPDAGEAVAEPPAETAATQDAVEPQNQSDVEADSPVQEATKASAPVEEDAVQEAEPVATEPEAKPEPQAAEGREPETASTAADAKPAEDKPLEVEPEVEDAPEAIGSDAEPEQHASEEPLDQVEAATEPETAEQTAPDAALSAAQDEPPQPEATKEPVDPAPPLPSFLRRPTADAAPAQEPQQSEPQEAKPEPAPKEAAPAPKARDIGMPAVTPEAEIHAEPSALARACQTRKMDVATAEKAAPLLAQLSALRDRMVARPGSAQPKS